MARFDHLEKQAFDAASSLFGEEASWTPTAGGGPYTAQVCFNRPNVEDGQPEDIYFPQRPSMQYHGESFPGLYEAVRSNAQEQVVINGESFFVESVQKVFDGDTKTAMLRPL